MTKRDVPLEPQGRRARLSIFVAAGVLAVAMLALIGWIGVSKWSEDLDKRDAISFSRMGQFVNVEDIRWVWSQSENDGFTYRYFAVVPADRINPRELGIPPDVDVYTVRARIPGISSYSDSAHRTISYFRETDKMAIRKVSLIVGVTTVEDPMSG
ncbi:hypothetical protein [Tsukamurella tyrosinosolvens]|uniref:hypothetical protein n=1 Tax=Tsukamurella tyrosinosolvens TaxID=57704 RepID=UPI002DD44E92|nr:hypothetical protein [Tsukamurella tyrosinosolvens]MEC4614494.1 hypothetical protein [Tsukamurella tyrosinosolvens]